jgi:tetratricopeptide (TPR) repeat protein
MKIVRYLLMLCTLIMSCSPVVRKVIKYHYEPNLLPFYGYPYVPKNDEMKAADEKFISQSKTDFPTLDSASRYYSQRGWDFFNNGDLNTSIKRFNQAWLLDSNNYNSYWGMAIITSSRDGDENSALQLMEKAIKLGSENCRVWFDYGLSNYAYFEKEKSIAIKNKSLSAFQTCIDKSCEESLTKRAREYIEKLSKL